MKRLPRAFAGLIATSATITLVPGVARAEMQVTIESPSEGRLYPPGVSDTMSVSFTFAAGDQATSYSLSVEDSSASPVAGPRAVTVDPSTHFSPHREELAFGRLAPGDYQALVRDAAGSIAARTNFLVEAPSAWMSPRYASRRIGEGSVPRLEITVDPGDYAVRLLVENDQGESVWGADLDASSSPIPVELPALGPGAYELLLFEPWHNTLLDRDKFVVVDFRISDLRISPSPVFYPTVRDGYRDCVRVRWHQSWKGKASVVFHGAGAVPLGTRGRGSQSWRWCGQLPGARSIRTGTYRLAVVAVSEYGLKASSAPAQTRIARGWRTTTETKTQPGRAFGERVYRAPCRFGRDFYYSGDGAVRCEGGKGALVYTFEVPDRFVSGWFRPDAYVSIGEWGTITKDSYWVDRSHAAFEVGVDGTRTLIVKRVEFEYKYKERI